MKRLNSLTHSCVAKAAGILFIISLHLYAQHPNVMVGETYEERTAYPNEPSIVINPKNTDEMIVTTNGPVDNYYYSTDGGATWNMSGSYSFDLGLWGDPCVIADTSGNFYFFHLELLWANYTSYKIHCRKLSFAGDTLSSPSFIGYNEPKFQDKEWAAFDPLTNNLYVAWTEFDVYGSTSPFDHSRILVSRSTDRGITWSTPDDVSQVWGNCFDDDETVEGAVPAIGPNGEVYLTWAGPEGIVFDRSMDYGETWLDEDIFVADNPGGWAFGPDEILGVYRADGQCKTACDISQGVYRGQIYVVWSDEYNGSDDHDVWVSKSTNGGNSWSDRIRVNDDPPGKMQFFPWITVDQVTGYVYVVFYDRRDHENADTDVYLAVSRDGGDIFENYKISESPFTPKSTVFMGDYTNLSAHNDVIRPVWARMDNYRDVSIWTAIIDPNQLTDVEDQKQSRIPEELTIRSVYPNPFNASTWIHYSLPGSGQTRLAVYDLLGKERCVLVRGYQSQGDHAFRWNGEGLPSGVYFVRLEFGQGVRTDKVILLK